MIECNAVFFFFFFNEVKLYEDMEKLKDTLNGIKIQTSKAIM